MIRISQIKMPIEHSREDLVKKAGKILGIPSSEIRDLKVLKRSVDSRKKPDLSYVYTICLTAPKEEQLVKRLKNKDVSLYQLKPYELPDCGTRKLRYRPVIVGAGPAGYFCAYALAKKGFAPIIVERGKTVEERRRDVEEFWKTGVLNPASNVVFGEGGAGTFSDGKLNTAVKDPSGRIPYVLSVFHQFGASESILYENKPHIGTDALIGILQNMRADLKTMGCDFYFETQFVDYRVEKDQLKAITLLDLKSGEKREVATETLILALGHGARDTFCMLFDKQLPMEAKTFAVGFRVEHPQAMIDSFAYGDKFAGKLPAAPYKVTSNFPNGRGVYSFCMCPGGYVVNSASGPEQTVVNGMSYADRASNNANSAIIVSLKPEDFDGIDALCGMRFQEELEAKTYALCKGKIPQQLFGDYRKNQPSKGYGAYNSCVKGETSFANLRGIMPEEMETSFIAGMEHFGKIIPGFDRDDAILSGTESRTSSPVRILRDQNLMSQVAGIYPCGEGAGYAGGITSAAVDGIKVAEAIMKEFERSY